MVDKALLDAASFNRGLALPFELRIEDFQLAMQDVYDFFCDVNGLLLSKGLQRLDEMLRPANMSGTLSDMLTVSLAKHSRALTQNNYFNGHPDLIVRGKYPEDSVRSGDASSGIEIKTTRNRGGAVDAHGAREQHLCVFVYSIDNETEPVVNRLAMRFTEVYIAHLTLEDYRKNPRGELGTRTATPHKEGMAKLRRGWVYLESRG